jgi:hypothetical protein
MLYSIGFFCLFCCSLFSAEHVYLKTPDLSRENIIGTVVGIRPCRKTGVRLEAEHLQDKLIVHNYGYGGSGLTLAFGGANEVLKILSSQKISSKVVAVLGAGVVGLTTAYDLLEKGYEVHLYSDQWSPNLTSNVAAGSWTPHALPIDISLEKKNLHERMLEVAERRFLKSTSNDPEFSGVKLLPYYIFTTSSNHETIQRKYQAQEVLMHFDNGTVKKGLRMNRIGLDGKLFMEDLYSKVKSKGAILEQKHFENLDELLNLKEPVIINCMSLSSREIFHDQEFIPARGQIIHLKPQDGIDYMLFQSFPDSNYFFHIYPWSDRIVLGGVAEWGEEEPKIYPETIDKIIQNAEKCLSGN